MGLAFFKDRPRFDDWSDTPAEQLMHRIAKGALLALLALVAYRWGEIPETIPNPLGATSTVTVLTGKNVLLMLPAMSLTQYWILGWIRRVPHWHDFPVKITERNARAQYALSRWLLAQLRALLAVMLLWNAAKAIRMARGLGRPPIPGNVDLYVLLLLLFLIIAVHLRRSYRIG